jgi:predicted MFS family arabinose efflux permease
VPGVSRPSARHARVTITAIFFLNGATFAAWYARLPAIQDDLGLSPGAIGLALLGAPLGLLLAQPAAGALIARRGSRAIVALAPLSLVLVVLPALAVSLPTLLLATVGVGAANGVLDIAMNAQGLTVERRAERPLFSSLHAAFSFGALAGATVAALVAGAGVEPVPHLLVAGAVAAVAAAVLALAAVSTLGYTGFLVGPPLIGLLAELVGLRGALVAVCATCGAVVVLAGRVQGQRSPAAGPALRARA